MLPCQSQLYLVCRIHHWQLCASGLLLPYRIHANVGWVSYTTSKQTPEQIRPQSIILNAVNIDFINRTYFWFPVNLLVEIILILLLCLCHVSSSCFHLELCKLQQSLDCMLQLPVIDRSVASLFGLVIVAAEWNSLGRSVLNVEDPGAWCVWKLLR